MARWAPPDHLLLSPSLSVLWASSHPLDAYPARSTSMSSAKVLLAAAAWCLLIRSATAWAWTYPLGARDDGEDDSSWPSSWSINAGLALGQYEHARLRANELYSTLGVLTNSFVCRSLSSRAPWCWRSCWPRRSWRSWRSWSRPRWWWPPRSSRLQNLVDSCDFELFELSSLDATSPDDNDAERTTPREHHHRHGLVHSDHDDASFSFIFHHRLEQVGNLRHQCLEPHLHREGELRHADHYRASNVYRHVSQLHGHRGQEPGRRLGEQPHAHHRPQHRPLRRGPAPDPRRHPAVLVLPPEEDPLLPAGNVSHRRWRDRDVEARTPVGEGRRAPWLRRAELLGRRCSSSNNSGDVQPDYQPPPAVEQCIEETAGERHRLSQPLPGAAPAVRRVLAAVVRLDLGRPDEVRAAQHGQGPPHGAGPGPGTRPQLAGRPDGRVCPRRPVVSRQPEAAPVAAL